MSERRPRIGITGSGITRKKEPRPDVEGNCSYIAAVAAHGGIPVVFPRLKDASVIRDLAALCDGFLIAGGEDVQPSRYNEEAHPKLGVTDPVRDELELTVLQEAEKSAKPVLGICRGLQILNVSLGGNLIQDLPSAGFPHPCLDLGKTAHDITVEKGTKLEKILGAASVTVNSSHHQAIDRLGRGLVVSARSAEGIIEGVEFAGPRFVVGVQSHPETMWNSFEPRFAGLFSALVAAAQKR